MRNPAATAVLGLFMGCTGQSALAQEAPYLDDRSDAASLVKSLYNAVNRKEYARAWDYFGETKPSKDFDAFVAGYSGTTKVTVLTGAASMEGAAGSTFFELPVAIGAVGTDGKERFFAGCYTAKLANPQIQGVPFRPLHIEKGVLKVADGPLAAALPESCGGGPSEIVADAPEQQAVRQFAAAYGDICQTLAPGAEAGAADPEVHEIGFHYSHDAQGVPERKATLFRFSCSMAAYNSTEIYYFADDSGDVGQLQFTDPDLDIRYEGDNSEGRLESISIIGYKTSPRLMNSAYDPDTRTITSYSKWRGAGDASDAGRWIFRNGAFTLVHYEVDPTYDGEINPQTLIDFDTAP